MPRSIYLEGMQLHIARLVLSTTGKFDVPTAQHVLATKQHFLACLCREYMIQVYNKKIPLNILSYLFHIKIGIMSQIKRGYKHHAL